MAARTTRRRGRAAKIPRVPRLRNVMDIRGRLRDGTLIHFTDRQWEQAIETVPRGRVLPKYGVSLHCYPIPGGVVAEPQCFQGPCEICRAQVRPGRRPREIMLVNCECTPNTRDPGCPQGDDIPVPRPPLCELALKRKGRVLYFDCVSHGCRGTCSQQLVRRGFHWVLTCRCA